MDLSLQFFAYAATAVLGLVAGSIGAEYKKFKDLLSVIDKAIEDNKITTKEITEVMRIVRR